MYPRHPEHLKTFDYIGPYRYFLTFCTHERRARFMKADAVRLVHEQILRAASDNGFAVLAYCYMPDHLHLLVDGRTDTCDCKRFISLAKQFSGYYFQQATGERLWQRYGFEKTLRGEHASVSVARYIVENPIRAGLVNNALEYPFAGSDAYSLESIIDAVQLGRGWRK